MTTERSNSARTEGVFESYSACARRALGRLDEAEGIGRVIASLASNGAGWIGAQTMEVTWGQVL